MIKVSKLATPVNKDGGRDLGGLAGAIIGAGLAYWGLSSTIHPVGTIIVLTVSFGALIGVVIGSAIGTMIDIRLTPKANQDTTKNNDAVPKKHSKGRMH